MDSKHRSILLAFAVVMSGVYVDNAEARRGGGGGGFRGGGGGARTSVSGGTRGGGSFSGGASRGGGASRSGDFSGSRNVDRNVNRSRDVNRDVNRDIDIDGDRGYYGYGGRYYGGAPVARAAAWGVAAGVTAAAIGSVAYSLPSGCTTMSVTGYPYYHCGGVYYQPQYSGTDVTYVVVKEPD